MKVVLINGSARDNGSCAYILEKVKEAMGQNFTEIIKYDISKMYIGYCRGCKACYTEGECVQNDDVEKIVKDILRADYIFIAAPSYWADVPGQLKTFFDRNTPFGDTNESRTVFAEKEIKGIGIAVRAGKTERENEGILDFIDHYFGHMGITPVKRFSVTEVNTLDDLLSKGDVLQSILDFAKSIGE